MGRINSFGAGNGGSSYARSRKSGPDFSSTKIQSQVVYQTGGNSFSNRNIRRRAYASNQNVVFCINQLYGVGNLPSRATHDSSTMCTPYAWPPVPPTPVCVYTTIPGAGLAIDFNNYNLGPISDLDTTTLQVPGSALTQWSGGTYPSYFTNDSGDREEIAQHPYCATDKAWKLTQVHPSPGQGSPFSPYTVFENNIGSEADFIQALNEKRVITTLSFASEQPGNGNGNYTSVNIYSGSYKGDDRTGFNVYLTQTATGIEISSYTYTEGQFFLVTFVQKFAYETCHTLTISATYDVNDSSKDVFLYSINGGTPVEILSWPNVWRDDNGFTRSYGTRLKFSANNTHPNNSAFFIDDINTNVQECVFTTSQTTSSPSSGQVTSAAPPAPIVTITPVGTSIPPF